VALATIRVSRMLHACGSTGRGASMAGSGSPGAGERGSMVPVEWREGGKEWMSFGMGSSALAQLRLKYRGKTVT
jgi:hypothetical protein